MGKNTRKIQPQNATILSSLTSLILKLPKRKGDMQWARQFLSDVSLAPRLVAVPPSISNIRCRENSKQNHKASWANPENLKMQRKMQMPKIMNGKCKKNATSNVAFSSLHFFATCDVAFSPLHLFATLNQLLYFFYEKKTKKCKKNAAAPKQMQRKMRKNATSNIAFSELHFFATCDVAFS